MNRVGKIGKQNRNAGKHPSYLKKGMSEDAINKKKQYDSEYQKKRVKYRVGLNKKNREIGSVGDGLDVSHTKGGKMVLERQSSNRARNGRNKKTTKK